MRVGVHVREMRRDAQNCQKNRAAGSGEGNDSKIIDLRKISAGESPAFFLFWRDKRKTRSLISAVVAVAHAAGA